MTKVVVSTIISGILFACFCIVDIIKRKLYLSVTWSTIRKRAKGTPDIIVKTTKVINFGFKKYVNFGKRKGEKLKKLNKNGLCIEVKNIIKSIEPLSGFCPRCLTVKAYHYFGKLEEGGNPRLIIVPGSF